MNYLLTAIYNDRRPKRQEPRRISTDNPFRDHWTAIDLNRYDGADDGDQTTGYGETESEAIQDLVDKYEGRA